MIFTGQGPLSIQTLLMKKDTEADHGPGLDGIKSSHPVQAAGQTMNAWSYALLPVQDKQCELTHQTYLGDVE